MTLTKHQLLIIMLKKFKLFPTWAYVIRDRSYLLHAMPKKSLLFLPDLTQPDPRVDPTRPVDNS